MSDVDIICAAVFGAVAIPLAVWRREKYVDRDVPAGDWSRLPGIFKMLWQPSYVFETSLGDVLARLFPSATRRYADLAEIAGLPLTGRRVFVCKALLLAIFALLGSLVLLVPAIPALVTNAVLILAPTLGWFFPSLALAGAAQVRQEEIVRALPFAIDLMGAAMRAGLDFGAAMRYYTGLGTGGALEAEFARVLRDATLGKPIAESLQDMAARVRIKTFTAFAGVVAYGTEIGASISDTLKIHGAEMRRERFSLAEQKAARAPSVMIFPLAAFILPAVFLIIFVPVLMQFWATQTH